jgi:type VI secretion system protein ImpH
MLRTQPRAFTLFAALRALEVLMPQRPRIGMGRPVDEGVRLAQPPHLEFAPTEVAGIEEAEGAAWQLEQFGFGLFGPNGALPLHLTELAFNRARHHGDSVLADFINALQHRWIGLFYRAWAASEPAVQADRPDADEFLQCLRALVGLDGPGAKDRGGIADSALTARPGLFATPRSAGGLEILLADYFDVQITLRSFVGRWLDIPADARLRIGLDAEHCALGRGATLGATTWQVNHSFELVAGPLDYGRLLTFLPGGRALEELRELVQLYTNGEWQWQLRILVDRASVPRGRLGSSSRLGQTSWLGGGVGVATDVVLQGEPSAWRTGAASTMRRAAGE